MIGTPLYNVFTTTCNAVDLGVLTPCCGHTNISYFEIRHKSSIFRLSYQPHSSSADCAKELFKHSTDLVSLRVCNEKNSVLGFCFFVSDIIRERFLSILAHVTWLRAQLPDQGSQPGVHLPIRRGTFKVINRR